MALLQQGANNVTISASICAGINWNF
jgi:hypothetical protein